MPSTATRNKLVSRRRRRAFRELTTDTVLREINRMWKDESFAPGPPNDESRHPWVTNKGPEAKHSQLTDSAASPPTARQHERSVLPAHLCQHPRLSP